jgi:hypothetical protein
MHDINSNGNVTRGNVTRAGRKDAPLHPHPHSAPHSPESHSRAAEKEKVHLLVREAELHMEAGRHKSYTRGNNNKSHK